MPSLLRSTDVWSREGARPLTGLFSPFVVSSDERGVGEGERDNGGGGVNVVALRGHLARPAEERVLPSGDRLVGFEVTVDRPSRRRETVPVVWFDAPTEAAGYDTDTAVVVVGRVRRRFFRAGGATASRTEVVADVVLPARQAKRVTAALRDAAARVEAAPDCSC
jgi:single-strand DNA-binding protein